MWSLIICLLAIFLILFIIYYVILVGLQDGLYYQPSTRQSLNEIVQIGPLEYPLENPSIITYHDLGKMGRTGNQLFEIAATIAIGYQNRCRVVFPRTIKNLPLWEIFSLEHLPIKDVSIDQTIREYDNYEEIIIPHNGQIYNLAGYRQSYLYFEPIRDYLNDLFPLKDCPTKYPNEYIAIHIRRTDFMRTSFLIKTLKWNFSCSLNYYRKAIDQIRKVNKLSLSVPIIICTDDPLWVGQNLTLIDPYAQLNFDQSQASDFNCLYHAPYLIMGNSTFSLWAGFLGKHKQVIAPSYWWDPNGLPAQLNQVQYQPICWPEWTFLDPITGEKIKNVHHWSSEYWSNKSRISRIIRAIFATNIFRENKLIRSIIQ